MVKTNSKIIDGALVGRTYTCPTIQNKSLEMKYYVTLKNKNKNEKNKIFFSVPGTTAIPDFLFPETTASVSQRWPNHSPQKKSVLLSS